MKRLFFGIEVKAPWIDPFPKGRILDENQRHLTLAFLGNVSFEKLLNELSEIPIPSFKIGYTGYFDKTLFLPNHRPNVVAWGMHFFGDISKLYEYQKELTRWLDELDYSMDKRPWLPHVTLARRPFNLQEWEKYFSLLPFTTTRIHLFESKGNLNYESLWNYPLHPPFIELDHTADIAFMIYGNSFTEIYHNALTALAFKEAHIIEFIKENEKIESVEDIIYHLNHAIALTDSQKRCSLKAVSYHGEIFKNKDNIYEWEMIVDV